jgi:hypothetical protein
MRTVGLRPLSCACEATPASLQGEAAQSKVAEAMPPGMTVSAVTGPIAYDDKEPASALNQQLSL